MRGAIGCLGIACGIALWVLGAGIYLLTLYFAYLSSFPSLLFTLFFPFLAQLVWIYWIWSATGVFFNILTILCLSWVGLGVLTLVLVNWAENKTA
jgi:hypothetical protein